MIELQNLSRDFTILQREKGFKGVLKSYFKRDYKVVHAINNINLNINEGDFLGIVGHNGAGKSTLIRMLSMIIYPTSGDIIIAGKSIKHMKRREYLKNIGVVFGHKTQLWLNLPLSESFKFSKIIYGINNNNYEYNLKKYCEMFDVSSLINTPVRLLSLGQRVRADIVCTLLHNPKILFLDEPTIGLDVFKKEKLCNYLTEFNQTEKVTIILTSHDLVDIETLSSEIMIIDKGKKFYYGTFEELKNIYFNKVTINIDGTHNVSDIEGVSDVKHIEGKTIFFLDNKLTKTEECIKQLLVLGAVSNITIEGPQLETIIKDLYKNIIIKTDL